ncbi:MAG: cysteine synthase A [Candidatus Gastranaerophilaceae bacterium]|nr:cysteine synthase A [Candidatus Gastranaerophilaceae bacterium]
MNIAKNMIELVGNTPLVKINVLNNGYATVAAKLECKNPAGSIKDRPALNMILQAEKDGLIDKDTTIIEPTSGNMGVGLAFVCAIKGYKLIITMPDTMSKERRALMKAYGAELVLTEGAKGMKGAVEKACELHAEIKNSFIPQQFQNKANPQIHYNMTAEEIWDDTNGNVDIIVAGVGTGGTISGVSKKLKGKNKNIKAIAVEPYDSQVLSGKDAAPHKIQGIGANFVPDNYNSDVIDEIFPVKNEDALAMTRELARKEGILAGISGGANIFAAIEISKRPENKGKLIVTVLPDNGERYLSCGIFD